jgi:hypothetical protein
MSNALKHIYNACDPFKPANADYYLDCASVLGISALTQEFQRHLELVNDGHLCFLVSGHIGCGKSSELEHFKRLLSQPSPKLTHERYFPILLNASDYLDDFDVVLSDILLAIVSEVAATMKNQVGIDLAANRFTEWMQDIEKSFITELGSPRDKEALWKAGFVIQSLKRDHIARQFVRNKLKSHTSHLLEAVNLVLEEARRAIQHTKTASGEQPYKDIVLIVDNLEKIRRIPGKEEGLESQRELFIEGARLLSSLQVHRFFTVPLKLARYDGPQLEQLYGPLFVLPMVKIIERNTRQPYEPGLSCLRELLRKRLGGLSFEEVFTPEALNFLLKYSGGHIRNLMVFVQNACTYATSTPIPESAAHSAVQQAIRIYSTAIPETHWMKLALLDCSPDQKIPNGDIDYLSMLENLSVLEYHDSNMSGDRFSFVEPWYAVNPIVRELQRFKSAVHILQNEESNGK